MPTSEEVLRRGFDWKTITGAYGGDNLQADFDTIRKFDHKRMDTVAVALKVRRISHLRFLPLLALLLTQNPFFVICMLSSIRDMPSPSLQCSRKSKIAMFVSTFLLFSIGFCKVRSLLLYCVFTMCTLLAYALRPFCPHHMLLSCDTDDSRVFVRAVVFLAPFCLVSTYRGSQLRSRSLAIARNEARG